MTPIGLEAGRRQILRRSPLRVSNSRSAVQNWPSCECLSAGLRRIWTFPPCKTPVDNLRILGPFPKVAHTKGTSAQRCANHSHQGDFCVRERQKEGPRSDWTASHLVSKKWEAVQRLRGPSLKAIVPWRRGYLAVCCSPSGKMILFTKKKITMEMPPFSTVVPTL